MSQHLNALQASDFITKYVPFGFSKREEHYKLIDPFCLFYLHFVQNQTRTNEKFWQQNVSEPSIVSWRGFAFENVCFNHVEQIKQALGISGVISSHSAWSKKDDDVDGTQIDLLIQRNDNVINMDRMLLMLFDASETDTEGRMVCTKTDEVSCNRVSQDVIDHVQSHFPQANIHFETELQDGVHILTKRALLLCVLIEPLYNAVHYSDGKHISLHLTQTESSVIFTIQDVGQGLPVDLPELTYNPFAEIDNLQIGTGMGLPLTRRHTACLGGSLVIDKSYREGCRIVIEMPK